MRARLFGVLPVYGLLIAFAILLATLLCQHEARRRGLPQDTGLDMILIAIPLAVIGARIYYVIFSWDVFRNDLLPKVDQFFHLDPRRYGDQGEQVYRQDKRHQRILFNRLDVPGRIGLCDRGAERGDHRIGESRDHIRDRRRKAAGGIGDDAEEIVDQDDDSLTVENRSEIAEQIVERE